MATATIWRLLVLSIICLFCTQLQKTNAAFDKLRKRSVTFLASNQQQRLAAPDPWQFAKDSAIVYTWINGSDPLVAQRVLAAGGDPVAGSSRIRDSQELRFSLRSVEQHMPWHTGPVYLVSWPGHIPDWLDTSNSRLKWIDLDSLVPPEDSPTFNSNVIEAYLHLIPGLSALFAFLRESRADLSVQPTAISTLTTTSLFCSQHSLPPSLQLTAASKSITN